MHQSLIQTQGHYVYYIHYVHSLFLTLSFQTRLPPLVAVGSAEVQQANSNHSPGLSSSQAEITGVIPALAY